jgi:carbamoyltransferase
LDGGTVLRCALKLTHDGTVAVASDHRLLASVEMEKLDNRLRYSSLDDLADVERVLSGLGVVPDAVDRWLIDGWVDDESIDVACDQGPRRLGVAPYQEREAGNLLETSSGSTLRIGGRDWEYKSYRHAAGHVLGAWATSPFAASGDGAWVLVWDGGLYPRLYAVDPRVREVVCHGPLFRLLGHAYAFATRRFGPFRAIWSSGESDPENTVAGKLMAYVALGAPRPDLVDGLLDLYRRQDGASGERDDPRACDGSGACPNATKLFADLDASGMCAGVPDADVLRAVHDFLERLLLDRLAARLATLDAPRPIRLCLAGGCALNIKWNESLRSSGIVDALWVPPFPNDAGSAIGLLASDLFLAGRDPLEWNAYLGPALGWTLPGPPWRARPCSIAELARRLADVDEPVVFLHGRAELGPRALGHRSLLASPRNVTMRDRLNRIKEREPFRPVAPMCLEHRAADVFDPGTRDPYMLFEHRVRAGWRERIPAVVHLDGSARVQTVGPSDDPVLFELLSEFERASGLPALCNTSANQTGCGFFPDAASAARWGRCRTIWTADRLFTLDEPGAKSGESASG